MTAAYARTSAMGVNLVRSPHWLPVLPVNRTVTVGAGIVGMAHDITEVTWACPRDAQRSTVRHTCCMKTSMRVDAGNRDTLARIATTELGGVSLDEALRIVLFEHESRVALGRLAADPDAYAGYLREAAELAEVDVSIAE